MVKRESGKMNSVQSHGGVHQGHRQAKGKCHFRQFGLVAVNTKGDWRSEHDRPQHGDLSHGK